ncbi:MAG: hypothetical protein LBC19_09110 [Tannerella sp.]|jgi:hypothetical protein|nr:hypothetical protein [Tannerella sp.]
MELWRLEGKKVRVIDMRGNEFIGEVGDYIAADDQSSDIGEIESIILDVPYEKYPMEFLKTEIKLIEIIK